APCDLCDSYILSAHCGDGISLLLADLTVIHMPNLSHFGLESKKQNKPDMATTNKPLWKEGQSRFLIF
ncbi:hypothetical protein, partial [Haloferula sp.]|uniref:hypothetical protein n=1 Tax=Haloferula sp. TaxID=2497595 RepID=UPI003C786C3E